MKKEFPKVSIIIPVFKTESYIRQCLDSVKDQTYPNLEIIIVDDGSPDDCGKICDEYALMDSRIKVIHKENGGIASAWNTGLSILTGDYFTFVDSDDWIELNAMETAVGACLENQVDLVCWGYYLRQGNRKKEKRVSDSAWMERDVGGMKMVRKSILTGEKFKGSNLEGYIWNKLFSANLLRKFEIRFTGRDVSPFFDKVFVLNFVRHVTSIMVLPDILYNYRILLGGDVRRYKANAVECRRNTVDEFRHAVDDGSYPQIEEEWFQELIAGSVYDFGWQCFFHPGNPYPLKERIGMAKKAIDSEPFRSVKLTREFGRKLRCDRFKKLYLKLCILWGGTHRVCVLWVVCKIRYYVKKLTG